jgi:hypothetical protein
MDARRWTWYDVVINCMILLVFVGRTITTLIGLAAFVLSLARWRYGASRRRRY